MIGRICKTFGGFLLLMLASFGAAVFANEEAAKLQQTEVISTAIQSTEADNTETRNTEASADTEDTTAAVKDSDAYKLAAAGTSIRVLLNRTGFYGVHHKSVTVRADKPCRIHHKNGIYTAQAGAVLSVARDGMEVVEGEQKKRLDFDANAKLVIEQDAPTEDGQGGNKAGLTVTSIKRGMGHPSYQGTLTVYAEKKGFLLVNELPLEDYLCGVVASEVPESYPKEALKAQAICARGFALQALAGDRYARYHADLDDGTNSQMYNNFAVTEKAEEAVSETEGLIPCYDGEPIQTFFFSTSCGIFCEPGDVWGGESPAYLVNHTDGSYEPCKLSDEAAFRDFIGKTDGISAVEEKEPYFRWEISFTFAEFSTTINKSLASKGEKRLGAISDFTVTKRGESGIVKEIRITGENGDVTLAGHSAVRYILSPGICSLKLADGSTVKKMKGLPSAFYYVVKTKTGFTIYGGGFGHGAGMSQNGAKCLGRQGSTAEEIVARYFKDVELVNIYERMVSETERESQ